MTTILLKKRSLQDQIAELRAQVLMLQAQLQACPWQRVPPHDYRWWAERPLQVTCGSAQALTHP